MFWWISRSPLVALQALETLDWLSTKSCTAAEQLENNSRVFTSLRNFKLPLDHRARNPRAEVDREKFNWSNFSQRSSCWKDISHFQSDSCVKNNHKILSIAGGFWVSLIVGFVMFFPCSGDISVITLALRNMQVWSDSQVTEPEQDRRWLHLVVFIKTWDWTDWLTDWLTDSFSYHNI